VFFVKISPFSFLFLRRKPRNTFKLCISDPNPKVNFFSKELGLNNVEEYYGFHHKKTSIFFLSRGIHNNFLT